MTILEINEENVPKSKLPATHPMYLDDVHMKLFLSYIRINGLDDDACWEFIGAVDKVEGYGKFRVGKIVYWAHRVFALNRDGEPTEGRDIVRHVCPNKNKLCMRHVKFGTRKDNWIDSVLDGTAFKQPKDFSKLSYSDESENVRLDILWKNVG